MQPAAHVSCELLLWLAGVAIGLTWTLITANDMTNEYDASFEALPSTKKWTAITFLFCSVVYITT